jgi:hypothetical protein
MKDHNRTKERDEVLFAFHQECTNPTAKQIIKWVEQYPEFADEIRWHAAIMKDWAARENLPAVEPSPALMARSESRAMDALHKTRSAAAAKQAGVGAASFDEILASCEPDVPALQRKLVISRGMLSALIGGRMLPPVGERLVAALTACLGISRDVFDRALQTALAKPRLGHARSDAAPRIIPRSYEDLVRASDMTEARKRYWLGEDA